MMMKNDDDFIVVGLVVVHAKYEAESDMTMTMTMTMESATYCVWILVECDMNSLSSQS